VENKYEIIDFYKSLDPSKRSIDEDIIILLVNRDIIPETIRYRDLTKAVKGAIKDSSGDVYYFNYVPDTSFRLVKAETDSQLNELNNILSKANLGADLEKEKPDIPEDIENKEDEEKAGAPSGGGGAGGSGQPSGAMSGEDVSSTPDRPDVGFDWHGDAFKRSIDEGISLIKSFTNNIQNIIPDNFKTVPPLEKRFLKEVLKYKDEDIVKGVRITSFQKSKYLQWVKEQAIRKTISLEGWLDS